MQKGMMQVALQKSWDEWKKDVWKLLVPNVMKAFSIAMILAGLIGLEIVLLVLGYDIRSIQNVQALVQNAGFMMLVILLLFFDYLIVRGVAAIFRSMNVGLFHDAVVGKKVDLQKMGVYVRKYWKVLFTTEVLVAVGVFIPTFLLGMVSLVVSRLGGKGVFVVVVLLTILYFLGSMLFALYVLFFVEPLLGQEYEGNALRLLRRSFAFSNAHKKKVILTALLIVGISLCIWIGLGIIGLVVSLPFSFVGFAIGFQVLARTVSFAAQQLAGVFQKLLVFNVFQVKK